MRTLLTALAFIALSAALHAQSTSPIVEGKHYERIATATAGGDSIEVLEVFNYGCPHCVSMQPYLRAWEQTSPAQVKLRHMPATFRPDFELYARGYYAAESLGLLEQTHAAMFEQAAAKRGAVRNFDEVAQMYADLGVDAAKLKAASASFAVDMRVREVNQRLPRIKVSFTPAFIVAGKYRVRNEALRTPAEVFRVIDHLIAKEASERGLALASGTSSGR